MPSLDDTYEALLQFQRALANFNEALSSSVADVKRRHEAIEGVWRDEAARQYQSAFGDFEIEMSRYVDHQAPLFEDFIRDKIVDLDRYLHGG